MTKKKVISVLVIIAVIASGVYAGRDKCKKKLPKAVKAAVKALCPDGEIKEFKKEKKSLKVYEVEVDVNGVEIEIKVACDGTVVKVETEQDVNSLPAAVAKAVGKKGGEVVEADKKVVYAELKLVKLAAPVTTYEIKTKKDGKTTEMKIADDGKILKRKTKKCKKMEKKCGKKEEKSYSKEVKKGCDKKEGKDDKD